VKGLYPSTHLTLVFHIIRTTYVDDPSTLYISAIGKINFFSQVKPAAIYNSDYTGQGQKLTEQVAHSIEDDQLVSSAHTFIHSVNLTSSNKL
jgi:hypothetical protein